MANSARDISENDQCCRLRRLSVDRCWGRISIYDWITLAKTSENRLKALDKDYMLQLKIKDILLKLIEDESLIQEARLAPARGGR